jgi:ribose transport system substrate-binding protein
MKQSSTVSPGLENRRTHAAMSANGKQLAIFIGDLARDNARQRLNGLIEILLGRHEGDLADQYAADQQVSGGGFVIVKTYLDGSNPTKANENAAQALKDYPELDGLIGLYGYNGPAILDAVTEGGKIGKVKIIAFDEFEKTLQGVADGTIHATIIQDPYEYGYETVRMLHSLSSKPFEADEAMGRGSMFLPCQVLRKDDVASYQKKLASRLSAASK